MNKIKTQFFTRLTSTNYFDSDHDSTEGEPTGLDNYTLYILNR